MWAKLKQIVMGKGVNVMGEIVEGLMAVMGITAGLMVVLTTLLFGDAPSGVERDKSHHDPSTIRPMNERMAA